MTGSEVGERGGRDRERSSVGIQTRDARSAQAHKAIGADKSRYF